MREIEVQGKRYVGLVRCSSSAQADTSLNAQNAVVAAYARERGTLIT